MTARRRLHPLNFLLHRRHDVPADVRVERRLGLLLQLNLALPEHDLPLRLDNLRER